jgi:hypothetical protein
MKSLLHGVRALRFDSGDETESRVRAEHGGIAMELRNRS